MLVDVCGTMCTKFCNKRTTFDKITVKTKYTDGPKFADPSMAAVSPYFKRSMHYGVTCSKFKSVNGSTVCKIATQHFPHKSHTNLIINPTYD